MALRCYEIEALAQLYSQELTGQRMSRLNQYDQDVFSFHLSKGKNLVFVVSNTDPYLYRSPTGFDTVSLSTPISQVFRKVLSNALIEEVIQVHKDRVLSFRLTVLNDVFKEETVFLVAELIPGKANLILLDENGTVITALRTNLITDPRPIFRGVKYEPPLSGVGNSAEGTFDLLSFEKKCVEKESLLSQRRKKTKFHALYQFLSSKKKASKRKISLIEQDIQKAEEHLEDGQYGSFIYTDIESIRPETGKMDYYGVEVALDPRKSAAANAEAFFRRSKKAKATLKMAEENLGRAIKEAEEYDQLFAVLEVSDEGALEKLSQQYGLDKPTKDGKWKTPLMDSAILPYVVVYKEVSYLFGKNANQNSFLSFLLETKKSQIWMHVKDTHGAHLIIKKENPTNAELQFGAELTLLASHLESGEVMYTEHRNVRRGQANGQAIVSEYQSAYLKSVSKEAKEAFEAAKKVVIRP